MINRCKKRTTNSRRRAGAVLSALLIFPAMVYAQPVCDGPQQSNDEVKGSVDSARETRTDLPSAFAEYEWSVRKEGCYYKYIEHSIPATLHANNIFTLDQHGTIVDVIGGARTIGMDCLNKEFTESELTEIINAAREKRSDMPPPFGESRLFVDRLRCLYLYFEFNVPEKQGDYQVFTIDPLGRLMEFSRNKPY